LPTVIAFQLLAPTTFVRSAKLLWPLLALLLFFYFILAVRQGLSRSLRLMTRSETVKHIAVSYVVALAAGFLVSGVLHAEIVGRPRAVAAAAACGGAALVVYHLLIRQALRVLRRRGYDRKIAVCVGINQRTGKILDLVRRWPELGIEVLGAFDEPSRKDRLPDARYLGDLDDLEDTIRRHVVDIVFITLPVRSNYDNICRVVDSCGAAGIEVRHELRLVEGGRQRSQAVTFGDQTFLTFEESPLSPAQRLVKRSVDIVLGVLLLVVTSPVLVLAALAVWLADGRPLVFRQQRVGYHGRRFTLLKFRTMVRRAEQVLHDFDDLNEAAGPAFKIRNDPRVTRLGRWLRRYSIDELPQLINVIRGDMSLVGPRPPLAEEVAQYEWQWRRRLSVRPGLTCIWQVSGRTEIKRFEDWMAMDLKYIDNYSLLLDLKILVRTIPAVLFRQGAY
jgi:exopolysaccharide biosynthesis polyprenyl glycosylphosphotransferase